jgi:8-oxo-dGTP pyrophosphatase MutT (NUDIX family)
MISFKIDDTRFNLRVAGVAVADGCVLLHQMAGDAFWTLPGGRPQPGETAAAALQREMHEETGLFVTVGRAVCLVENFFTYRGCEFHEILMCFEMSVSGTEVTDRCFEGIADSEPLTFWWCPLTALDDALLRPVVVRDVLRTIGGPLVHLVQDDRSTSPA